MINKIILMGRLTADPELRQTQSGVSTIKFTIAVNRNYTPKNGEDKQADFINIVAWRQTAEFVAKYFSKGKMIIVEGSLRNNNYTDKNGIKHYTYDVFAENAAFGESKTQQNSQNNTIQPNSSTQDSNTDFSEFEEILSDGDMPF